MPGLVQRAQIPDVEMQRRLNSAVDVALRLLQNGTCASLFTSPTTGASAFNPATLLSSLNSMNSPYGGFTFGGIQPRPVGVAVRPGQNIVEFTNATTTGTNAQYHVDANGNRVFDGFGSVNILINNNPNSPYNQGTDYDRAITLLHELGHAFVDLFGADGSHVLDDQNNTAASQRNSDVVRQNCPQ